MNVLFVQVEDRIECTFSASHARICKRVEECSLPGNVIPVGEVGIKGKTLKLSFFTVKILLKSVLWEQLNDFIPSMHKAERFLRTNAMNAYDAFKMLG